MSTLMVAATADTTTGTKMFDSVIFVVVSIIETV